MNQLKYTTICLLTALLTAGTVQAEDIFLDSTIAIDLQSETITLPLFKGKFGSQDVYYILTESSSRSDAENRGLNYSPKLANALETPAVQTVESVNGVIQFKGTVDFSPQRVVVPSETGFPPAVANPGSVGDANYSPLITYDGKIVLNAPQVANASGVHDSVISIDTGTMQVTLALVAGFYHGKEILYISTEASDFGTAALEESTFAPNLNAAPGLASGDPTTSARSAIVPFVNGQTGPGNPERQGLMSALLGEGPPLNVTEIHPRNKGKIPTYSPLWDVHPAVWTEFAIAAQERVLIDHHDDIADGFEDGFITSGGMGPANPELGGLRAAGFIVNCPIMWLD